MASSPRQIFARLGTTTVPSPTETVFGRVIVLGGSVAGLLAARVLADHAETVLIIEQDQIGEGVTEHPGVPHSGQLHTLQPGGREQLDRWFPGFSDEAIAGGAVVATMDAYHFYLDGEAQANAQGDDYLSCGRPFLESLIRRRTLALPNVTVIASRVVGLDFSPTSVTGVRHLPNHGADPVREDADFVVDALGRASKLSHWLEQSGWERPPLRRMAIDLNYSTAIFRRAEPNPGIATAVARWNTVAPPPDVGGTAITAIEDDRWLITLAGYANQHPGRTRDDFLRTCGELPPEWVKAIAGEMLGDVSHYHLAESRRRDFARLRRFPARLVSVGDAVASFNPVHAQGLTSAALQASALSAYLGGYPRFSEPAREFFAMQQIVVDAAWQVSTFADLALPHVTGPYPRGYRLIRWMNNQVVKAALRDRELGRRLQAVIAMRSHPAELAAPGTLLRAFWINARNRLTRHRGVPT